MKIPIGSVWKIIYPLYTYFFKGAKIDASLEFYQGGAFAQDPNRNSFKLTLKNNSSHAAYQIKLLNAKDIFFSAEKMDPIMSLKYPESAIVFCRFKNPLDNKEDERIIPQNILGKQLIISYKNEGRKTFYTKFTFDDKETINEYYFRNPLK